MEPSTSVEADCRNSGLVRVLLVGTVLPTGTECRRRTELRSLIIRAPQTAKERASEELQARSTPRIPPPPLLFSSLGRNDPHDLTCNPLLLRLAVLNLRRAVHWPEQEVGPGSLVRPPHPDLLVLLPVPLVLPALLRIKELPSLALASVVTLAAGSSVFLSCSSSPSSAGHYSSSSTATPRWSISTRSVVLPILPVPPISSWGRTSAKKKPSTMAPRANAPIPSCSFKCPSQGPQRWCRSPAIVGWKFPGTERTRSTPPTP